MDNVRDQLIQLAEIMGHSEFKSLIAVAETPGGEEAITAEAVKLKVGGVIRPFLPHLLMLKKQVDTTDRQNDPELIGSTSRLNPSAEPFQPRRQLPPVPTPVVNPTFHGHYLHPYQQPRKNTETRIPNRSSN